MTTAATVRALPAPSMPMGEAQSTGALVVAPQNFGEVIAFADRMAQSRFVPAHLRGKPADCMAVCLQALRWGMDPFMVAQQTYFVKEGAAPGYQAQLVNAVIYARAPLDGRLQIAFSGVWPKRICTVRGRFKNDQHIHERIVEAELITTRNSPLWKADPDQQLAYYATRAWARLYAPDVLMGVYTPDEVTPIAGGEIAADESSRVSGAALLAQASAGADVIYTEAEPVAEAEHVDPETGEVTSAVVEEDPFGLPPIEQAVAADLLALASRLETDMLAHETQTELKAWFSDSADVTRLRDGSGEFYADLLGKVRARMKALKK